MQKDCVKMCSEEGNRTLDNIHQESVDLLTRELRNLNFDLKFQVFYQPQALSYYIGRREDIICSSYLTSCRFRGA